MSKAIVFVVLLFVFPAAQSVDHTVGGSTGWTTGFNYTEWASRQTFRLNDNLVFNFGPPHSVDRVNSDDFGSCSSASPIRSYTASPATITLNTTGEWYFLCPVPGHCSGGQRLSVNVAGGSAPSTPGGPPASGGSAPSTPGGPPAAGGTPAPSAATVLGEGGGLVVAGLVSLVMAGLMG
ncbi:Cupredoxin superfamily protein [Striga hermonthica]|uniref:Cupredoxin superfamily protein n=1 Tax=Striga hermonthica TaxID=68872 RepID=A0A9N7N2R0_STRHE|nr:Cupredoxin superfamily protein [Striga hermonthica]